MANRIEMSEKMAVESAEKMFEALKTIFSVIPLKFSNYNEEKTKLITIFCDQNNQVKCITQEFISAHEHCLDLVYKLKYKGNVYMIKLFCSADACGYNSCLPSRNDFTYTFCNMVEERWDGSKRLEMDFAFDIEKKIFIELFWLEHFNKNNVIRECRMIDYVETLLSGKEII